jgi:hypothetical protein
MSVKKAGPDHKPRVNYIVCVDIVVLVCIVVIAGRPDGLAITVSAIIVAILAMLYRCTVNIKSYVSKGSRRRAAPASDRQSDPQPPVEIPAGAPAGRTSWLRESN